MGEIHVTDWALDVLRCPVTKQRLAPASKALVNQLLALQSRGELVDQTGVRCSKRFESGMVNHSETLFHLVTHGIVSLLPGEAIDISRFIKGVSQPDD